MRLFLIKGGGKYHENLVWNCSRLEPLRFYGLTGFVSKNICIVNSFWCSAVFFIVILISVSNISPRIIMKRKKHSRRNKTTLYLRLKTCWKFPHKREHQTSTSLWELGLYLGGVAKNHARAACVRTRDCEGRGERRVVSRLALLSSRLNENSCLAHHSLSWQFRSIVEPWRLLRFTGFIGYWYHVFTSILT